MIPFGLGQMWPYFSWIKGKRSGSIWPWSLKRDVRTLLRHPRKRKYGMKPLNIGIEPGIWQRWALVKPEIQVRSHFASMRPLPGQRGRLHRSGKLYQEVLTRREEVLGFNHDDILFLNERFALFLEARGKPSEATELCKRVKVESQYQ